MHGLTKEVFLCCRTKNVLVERPGEVYVEELLVVDGQAHHPTSKIEVAEVVRVDIGQTVRLECCTYMYNVK